MAFKPMPKPLTERGIAKKYQQLALESKGRLDRESEKGRANLELVGKYYRAFANIYGGIWLGWAWKVFAAAEKELTAKKKILKKDFLAFSEVARYEEQPYYILEIDEVYPEELREGLDSRLLMNKALYHKGYARFSDYYRVAESQYHRPLYYMKKEELEEWAEPGAIWRTPEGEALKEFVERLTVDRKSLNTDVLGRKLGGKKLGSFIFWSEDEKWYYDFAKIEWEKAAIKAEFDIVESEKILREAARSINVPVLFNPMQEMQYTVKRLEEVGVILTKHQLATLVQLFVGFNNHTRKWCLNGNTSDELTRADRSPGPIEMMFGPGMQEAFRNGDLDRDELTRLIESRGFKVRDYD